MSSQFIKLLFIVLFLLTTTGIGYYSIPARVVGHTATDRYDDEIQKLTLALVGLAVGVAALVIYDIFFRRRVGEVDDPARAKDSTE